MGSIIISIIFKKKLDFVIQDIQTNIIKLILLFNFNYVKKKSIFFLFICKVCTKYLAQLKIIAILFVISSNILKSI